MDKKLKISRWLMLSSVLIIVGFQAYWLKRVYNESYFRLQREISVEIREAFLKQQFQFMFGDSASHHIKRDTVQVNGSQLSVVIMNDSLRNRKSGVTKDRGGKDSGNERTRDSNRSMPPGGGPPRFMAFETAKQDIEPGKNLIVTLPILEKDFKPGATLPEIEKLLDRAGLPSRFVLRKSEMERDAQVRVRRNNGSNPERRNFQMVFADLDFGSALMHILSKMWGQIALAFFLVGIVILAFRFMYKSLKEQHRMAAMKNDFISNMTHELKTPVATVSVAIEALKNFSVLNNPERTREYLDISAAELNRLSLLIDKVLRINMFEAEKLEIEKQAIDLCSLTAEVVQAQQLQAEKFHAKITWQAPPQSVLVKGDRLHLMSVLYNLLDNALKYRSEHPEIEVGLRQIDGRALWWVRDNGPGIAQEYQGKIFEKFFRVPQGDRHDTKGYGLGLSYVHEVVHKHGGAIQVDCEPGKGCTFTVNLPVEINHT